MSNFRDRLRSYKRWFQHQMSGSPLEFEEPTLPLKYIDLSTSIRPFENYLLAICLNGRYWRLKTLTFTLVLSFTILFFFNRGYVTHNLRQFYFDSVLHQAHSNFYWSSIVEQGKNPFTPNVHPYGSHESNRTDRKSVV